MKQEKIVVCYPFVGDSIGGSHISTLILAESLPIDKYEYKIIVHQKGPLTEYLDTNKINYILAEHIEIVPTQGSIIRQVFCMFSLFKKIKQMLNVNNIDLVHTNDLRIHYTWVLASKLSSKKTLWHQRSAYDSRRNSIYTLFANKILTISSFCKNSFPVIMKQRAIRIYDPFIVDRNILDRSKIRNKLLKDIADKDSCYIIAFFGRFIYQKRPELFLKIAEILKKSSDKKFIFCMFGNLDNEQKDKVLRFAEEKRILELKVMGGKYPVEPWMHACDVVVAPAINEGLGRTLVEAQLLGIPVVATKNGGHLEVINHKVTGLLASPEDPQSFANEILWLLENPEKKENMISKAKDFSVKTFSVINHVKSITRIYEEVT